MNKKFLNLILALLMYLPTCIYVSLNLYFVLFALVIYLNFDFLKHYFTNLFKLKVIDKNFTFILVFSFLALLYRLIDYQSWESINDIYSFAYLFPLTYIIARTLDGRSDVFKYIIYLMLIEFAFSILEYFLGVSTIFSTHENYRVFETYDLMYFTRVYGLSSNSSLLSFKYIFGLIFLNLIDIPKWRKVIFEFLLLVGSVLTFGRIALIVVFFYLFLRLIDELIRSKRLDKLKQLPFLLILLFFTVSPQWTLRQFTRNNIQVTHDRIDDNQNNNLRTENNTLNTDKKSLSTPDLTKMIGVDKIDMSGRNEIWNNFLNFTGKNIHFGNFGKKLMIGKYHAHNSFIELIASYGIYMFLFMMFIIFRKVTFTNYVFIFSLGLLAMGQYLVFWGVSLFDILFYYLIFFYKKDENK